MPFDRTNQFEELDYVFATDPEALAMFSKWEVVDWRSFGEETYTSYSVVQVQDGQAVQHGTYPYMCETRGEARAQAHNMYQVHRKFCGEPDSFTVEIRKEVNSKDAPCVQKTGQECWQPIMISLEVVETIKMC